VHDTAQVMGAALTYKSVFHDEVVFTVAAVTKLTRNVFLAAAIPYLAWRSERGGGGDGGAVQKGGKGSLLRTALPPFVLCFLGMAALRTAGDSILASGSASLLPCDAVQWKALCSLIGNDLGSHFFLGTAMAAVGGTTRFAVLRGVGVRGFILGAVGSLSVALAAASAVTALAMGGLLT
jgi:uncharacterized membrane protein YadS